MRATVHDMASKLERDYVRSGDLLALERRIASLEASQTWAVRLVMGLVIVALVGLVITQGAS